MPQKYKRGDVVHIAEDLGPCMSHFESGADVIVMYSYLDKYGGDEDDEPQYGVMFCENGSEVAWYHEPQLTFLRHGGEEEIAKVRAARKLREKSETNLEWIVANWPTIKDKVPGATLGFLMRQVGITDPWGPHGEGMTYYANARGTLAVLKPVLETGDIVAVRHFLDTNFPTHKNHD